MAEYVALSVACILFAAGTVYLVEQFIENPSIGVQLTYLPPSAGAGSETVKLRIKNAPAGCMGSLFGSNASTDAQQWMDDNAQYIAPGASIGVPVQDGTTKTWTDAQMSNGTMTWTYCVWRAASQPDKTKPPADTDVIAWSGTLEFTKTGTLSG